VNKLKPATLEFNRLGHPYSSAFDDIYHSADGGPAQSRHVFLAGNQLPERWQRRDRFVILETGFGLGLNFMATWQAWQNDPQRCRRLHFISFEKHPFAVADLVRAHQAWPEFASHSAQLLAHWPSLTAGFHRLYLDQGAVTLTLVFGDASSELRTLNAAVDAFFLDGFAPSNNPELWSPYFCKGLARLAAREATLATWSVAATLRAALSAAEFDVEKQPGFASKRQMLSGHFRSRRPNRHPPPSDRRAIVIGAGIAGATSAHRLAAAGWQVTVLEQNTAPGRVASGNLAGVMRPLPSADDNRLSRLTRAGYNAMLRLLATLPAARWSPSGVVHLARDSEHEAQQQRAVDALDWPPAELRFLDRHAACQKLGWPVNFGGWYFPGAGWVQPASVCRAALAAFPEHIDLRCNVTVSRLAHVENHWQALGANGEIIAEAPVLVMASGVAATTFSQFSWLPQFAARGQVSHLPAATTPPIDVVAYQRAYILPAIDGWRLIGATHAINDDEAGERRVDHRDNLESLQRLLPGYATDLDPAILHGLVGQRPMSPDRLPIVGPVPVVSPQSGDTAWPFPDNSRISSTMGSANTRLHDLPLHPGLWCVQGFGARGIVWSALMADLLLSRLEGEPLPLENDLVNAIDPGRFLLKRR
jgi:tRNA 5-methylaminomethyl-2-thiouridine biosynthesis bifunctional protein